jgi:NosR/NirI family transcriptional regulator, nitrous oxide reductase regulator
VSFQDIIAGMKTSRTDLALKLWHLALLIGGLALVARYDAREAGRSVKRAPTAAELTEAFGGATDGKRRDDPLPHYEGTAGTGTARQPAAAVSTTDLAPAVKGYVDEINALVVVDKQGTIRAVRVLAYRETPAYMRKLFAAHFFERFIGKNVTGPIEIDAVTGASVSSRALRDDVLAAARQVASRVYGLPAPGPAEAGYAAALSDPRLLAIAAGLALALGARFSPWPRRGRREAAWVTSVILIGIYGMTPYTLVHTFQLLRGQLPGPANPMLLLLASFVIVTTVLFGPVWCGYGCPFGALEELLAKVPVRRWQVRPRLMRWARELRYLVLFAAVAGFFGLGVSAFAEVEPFGHLFARTTDGVAWAFIGAVLVGALFVKRFWCRFFCPTGACLVLLSAHRRYLRSIQRGLDDAGIDRPDREEGGGGDGD